MASAPAPRGQHPEDPGGGPEGLQRRPPAGFERRPGSPEGNERRRLPVPRTEPTPLPARPAEVVRAPLVDAVEVPLPPRSAELVPRPSALPAVRPRRPRRRWPAALVVLACAGLALGAALRVGPFAAPAPTASETRLVADADALAHTAFAPFAQWDAQSGAAIQVAGFTRLVDALGDVSALNAARAAMLVAAALTVLLTGALARRFGLSVPATALAGVITAALPEGLAAHRMVAPINLALPWLLAAALLASSSARRRLAAAPAVLCLAAAVVTSVLVAPVALAAVGVLLAGRDIGVRWRPVRRFVLAGVLFSSAAVTLAAGVGVAVPGRLLQPLATPEPGVVDLVVLGVVGAAAVYGLFVRWLRPFALVFLGCLGAALAGPNAAPLLLVALPAGALLLGAAADSGTERTGARKHVRRLVPLGMRSVILTVVVLLAGVGLALTAPGVSEGSAAADPARAAGWARTEAARATLVVDDAVWTAANAPDGMLRYRDAGRLGTAPEGEVFLIGRPPAETDVAADSAWHRSVELAAFGATQVRLLVPSRAAYQRRFAADQQARRSAGAALAPAAPRLTVAPAAAPLLAAGDVDARLLTVLASLSAAHRVTLAELPAVPGESGPYSPRRRARITSFDGATVAPGSPAARTLRQWLTAQVPPYQPTMSLGPAGLTLRYPAPSPLGLLAP